LERLRELKGKRVLIITDQFMERSGVAERIAGYFSDCSVTVFADVIPDPTIEVVTMGVERLQE
jgi:alcohol dehydrogenase class IV